MSARGTTRREFLRRGALAGSALAVSSRRIWTQPAPKADHALRIATTPIEVGEDKILSLTTYNGQFPGPLLRFRDHLDR